MAHPDLGRSVHPTLTRGTDYAHLITTGTPGFSDFSDGPGLLASCQKVPKFDFQSQFSMSNIILIFLNFFFH
jgi:hypothetical protein